LLFSFVSFVSFVVERGAAEPLCALHGRVFFGTGVAT
jgi:hypothetical protein